MIRQNKILRDKRGASSPMTIALVLGLLLFICAIWEFFRLGIIVQGVREGLQEAVIAVVVSNYDDTYNGLREGYSGGYRREDDQWVEMIDYDDVYRRLDRLLGTQEEGEYHVKVRDGGFEYRISGLVFEIENVPLTPGNAEQNFQADIRIQMEIPLSFGWELVPPLIMEVRTKAAYMPKF